MSRPVTQVFERVLCSVVQVVATTGRNSQRRRFPSGVVALATVELSWWRKKEKGEGASKWSWGHHHLSSHKGQGEDDDDVDDGHFSL